MSKLVKFQNPPLIEVVMGIQFESEIFSEKMTPEKAAKHKVPVMYAAFLKKNKK